MRIKTHELIGRALDHAVGKAQGWVDYPEDSIEHGRYWHTESDRAPFGKLLEKSNFRPSTHPADAWSLIERIDGLHTKTWLEAKPDTRCQVHINNYEGDWAAFGPTLLIAIMRCYVASKLGEWVEIPDELLEEAA